MSLLEELRESWRWVGIEPIEVVGENDFGNLIIKDKDGKYWRLCPEDLSCKVIAKNRKELDALSHDQVFLHDWYMKNLVEEANVRLGPLTEGRKYCLKIPGVLGGEYGGSNLATISLVELVRFSGYVAKRIKDLPDGAQVEFKITD
jgi:hypothetical protein